MSFLLIPIGTYPNTFLGFQSSISITTGVGNTAFGESALKNNTAGGGNTAVGALSMFNNDSGDQNTSLGNSSMFANLTGQQNAAFGHFSLQDNTSGSANTAIGGYSLRRNNGTLNTAVGYNSGYNITTGSKNTILGSYNGNQGGLDIRTLSNYIVLSDGDGNPRLWINNTGAVNIPGGTVLPGGTANGVLYLNGSKVLTSGSALTFDGTDLATTGAVRLNNAQYYYGKNAAGTAVRLLGVNAGNVNYVGAIDSGPTEVNYGAATTITTQYWNISGSEKMRLTSTGLGIGTTSPATRLDVTGAENTLQARFGGVAGRGLEISTRVEFSTTDSGSVLNAKGAGTGTLILQTESVDRLEIKNTGQTRFIPLAADPAGAENGDVYYNSSTNKLRVYNGTAWVDLN